MLRSAFNYLRYGWTRQKVETSFNEFLATMIKLDSYEDMPRICDNSLVCRSFLKSLARLYPDLTVRYMAQVVAAMPDPKSPEAWDCLNTMIEWSYQGRRVDPHGVHDALKGVVPFMEHFPKLDFNARHILADLEKADPDYQPQPLLT